MKTNTSQRRLVRWLALPILFTVLIAANSAHWNSATAAGEEWRPVDPAHLALKTSVVEANADAEAIFWDVQVDDGGADDLVLSHYVRIKIFTERGRENHSKIEIPFLKGVKIKDVAARTVKPDGSFVELLKEDIIEKTIVKVSGLKLKTKTFAFPGIEPGAIVEYKWKEVISNSSANYLRLQFQRNIPVQSVTYRLKPSRSQSFDVRAFNMAKPTLEKQKNGFYSTTVTKMPAFQEEPMMPPEDSVRSWAMFRYQNFLTLLTGYSMQALQTQIGFEPFMKVDKEIQQKATEIIAGATTPEQKLDKIFTFCRTSIKNTDDKNSGFTEEQLEKLKENKKPADTLKRGVGPAIDINLLFAALAKAAGFEAHMALTPDRGKRLFDRQVVIPGSLGAFNIAVKVGESWKFFAPGLQHLPPGMLRWEEEGVDTLIASDNPVWTVTPMSPPEKTKELRTGKFKLDENGTLEGDVTVEYTGHLAVERRLMNDEDSPAQREENLKESVKGRLSTAELTDVVIENVTEPAKPLTYKYHVRVPEYAQRVGKRLLVQPAFFLKGIEAMFSAGTRRYPVYFHFPWSEEDRIEIALPKGFVLDNADRPSPINVAPVAKYEVKMGVTKDDSMLMYVRTFFFGGNDIIMFPVNSYPQVKRLFDEVNRGDNHMIALKQAGAGN